MVSLRSFLKLKALTLLLVSAFALGFAQSAASGEKTLPPPQTLTSVRQIRSLSADQAGKSMPIRIRGLVTVPSTYKNSFFFMDATGGISIDRPQDQTPVAAGDLVDIVGTTAPGLFAPVVNAVSVKVTSKGTIPRPRLYEMNELSGGQQDSQWIGLRGVVRSASVQTVWERQVLVLDFDMGVGDTI